MNTTTRTKIAAVGTACALMGAGAGTVVASTAATDSSGSGASATQTAKTKQGKKQRKGGLAQRAVHAQLTLATKDGFKQATIDRGRVASVDGTKVVVTQGRPKGDTRQTTIDVGAKAKVRVNKDAAKLSDVQKGQRITIVKAPKQTLVRAVTPKKQQRP